MCHTSETLICAPIALTLARSDADFEPPAGVYFLRRSTDAHSGQILQTESGAWLGPAEEGALPDPFGVLCLSRGRRGEHPPAVGALNAYPGPPTIAALDVVPLTGEPANGGSREAAAGLRDPHTLLRRELERETVTRTLALHASSVGARELADALALSGVRTHRFSDAHIELDVWLESVEHARCAPLSFDQLQLSRREFARERAPHGVALCVATLRRAPPDRP